MELAAEADLRFSRQTTGEVALRVQDDLATAYAGRYPGVTQRLGLELSHALPHLNWFGGTLSLPDYTGVSRSGYAEFLAQTAVPAIHAAGGLASYNHPFGTSAGPALPQATQDDLLSQQAATMLGDGAVGADILEVGYALRAGVDLGHHVALWDVCSRNALFLTGNGVSNDHKGVNWAARGVEWTTSAWAPDTLETSLLDSLRAGRAWCGSMTGFTGGLDLLVDGECPMGSVSVLDLAQRDLVATATGMPRNGSLRIVQGVVDYAGPGVSAPATQVLATIPAGGLSGGTVDLPVDTGTSSFVRTEVLDSTGTVVALSNPVWLLQETPPKDIPQARAC